MTSTLEAKNSRAFEMNDPPPARRVLDNLTPATAYRFWLAARNVGDRETAQKHLAIRASLIRLQDRRVSA